MVSGTSYVTDKIIDITGLVPICMVETWSYHGIKVVGRAAYGGMR